MKKLLFKGLNYIGNIYLEQILFDDFVEPIVFVGSNDSKDLFLCLCTETRGFQRWIFSQTNYKILINLLKGRLDTCQAIKLYNEPKYIIDYTFDNGYSIKSINSVNIDPMEFPSDGVYIDEEVWSEGVEEYLNYIKLLQKSGGDLILGRGKSVSENNKSFYNKKLNLNPTGEFLLNNRNNAYRQYKSANQPIISTNSILKYAYNSSYLPIYYKSVEIMKKYYEIKSYLDSNAIQKPHDYISLNDGISGNSISNPIKIEVSNSSIKAESINTQEADTQSNIPCAA